MVLHKINHLLPKVHFKLKLLSFVMIYLVEQRPAYVLMCVCVCILHVCVWRWGHQFPTHSSRASPPAIIILLFISALTMPKISY